MGAKTRKLSQINDSLIEWQSVVTASTLTAVAGRGYFINTTSNACTVTTPASPKQGDKIVIVDYAGTFATNNVTINFNGAKVFGASNTATLQTNYQVVDLIFIDSTQGWRTVNQDTTSDIQTIAFISATGGTVTTSGNFKIHTFTGDGCFVVSCAGNSAGSNSVDYLVIAGGGGGGNFRGGGGGAGGFREGRQVAPAYTASPLVAPSGLPVSVTTYPVTVGGGGAGSIAPVTISVNGSNSVFSTITSAGGGAGGGNGPALPAQLGPIGGPRAVGNHGSGAPGGSGGGAEGRQPNSYTFKGSGNTPPTSPSQGNDGGLHTGIESPPDSYGGGGGGGAGASGFSNPNGLTGGAGGTGATTSISASPTTYAGGGGGGSGSSAGAMGSGGAGGPGGGGNGKGGASSPRNGDNASTNTGGGGGSSGHAGGPSCGSNGGNGGKGIVIIRYKYQ
jgi:hypothetical protein